MRSQKIHVSDSELAVLQVIWKFGPAKVAEIQEHVRTPQRQWAYNTVQTLLVRLENKGVVESRKVGRANVFSASLSREEYLDQHLENLAERVFDGNKAPLMIALVENQALSKDEIARLRALLDRLDDAREQD